jgi:RimJ/RimL family protein N-acetyltransferase
LGLAGHSEGLIDTWFPGLARSESRAALIVATEGSYLAGDPDDGTLVPAFADAISTLAADGMHTLWLDVHPEAWDARLPEVLRHDWRAGLPEGYEVRAIDGALLADPALHVPEHIHRWIKTNWGSRESFLRLGFGRCALSGNEVASWSVCDCVSGEACEIGVQTAEAHRRRGLAAATAAAAAEHALGSGYRAVGWHCDDDNVGSWRTAERVGFAHDASYTFRVCQF